MNYTVVQSPTISDPVQPGESVTLQCSVLSGSQMGSCPSEDRVLWFGVRKDTILGSIIYTDGNTPYECDTKSDMSSNSKRCVYHLLKNVSSSDSGIYYCALAMCGEIIFGNGTKLEVEGSRWSDYRLPLTCTVVAICGLVFIITIGRTICKADNCLQGHVEKQNLKEEEDSLIYTTVIFTLIENNESWIKDVKAVKREKTQAVLKPFRVE
ncbi:uncharacterized protein LOC118557497 [Fundulus heteroclitus]|uniref:uncharacterized protein LOC118557497 n=1 Tax=Fundulus heteroclitus TaxID=8078 RepID=UPI00165BF5F1|nr:uncharacterized protein LOC118557497 [Fundulus heteroclitus]